MSSGTEKRTVELPCPSCGVMVRKGLVRCWSCNAFMRADIQAAHERMQAAKPNVGFEPLPEHPSEPKESRAPAKTESDDSGFELGASFAAADPEARTGRAASAFYGKREKEADSNEKPQDGNPAKSTEPAKEPTADAAKEKRRRAAEGASESGSHSEETAGDVLLQGALQEERERPRRNRSAFDPVCVEGGWMITCPCPAHVRIKIREAHRGKTGKCPNPQCGSYFTVPANLPEPEEASAAAAADQGFPADPADKAGPFTHWLRDVRLHVIKPAKARRKPSGHEKDFQPADIGFAKEEGLSVISLASKPAGLMGKAKKPEEVRQQIVEELNSDKPTGEISSQAIFSFEPETLTKMKVEYPPAYEHESTFAGVPVFGEGRIAVKLPPAGADDEQHFVALTITQYRRLEDVLEGLFEFDQLGFACPIPTDDDVVALECHYSENKFTILRNPTFHLADPDIALETLAYRCESCGLIVSEDSRKKEKIGGLEGKKLGSAKCPKCKGKFGKNPLYGLAAAANENKEDSAPAAEEPSEPAEAANEE